MNIKGTKVMGNRGAKALVVAVSLVLAHLSASATSVDNDWSTSARTKGTIAAKTIAIIGGDTNAIIGGDRQKAKQPSAIIGGDTNAIIGGDTNGHHRRRHQRDHRW